MTSFNQLNALAKTIFDVGFVFEGSKQKKKLVLVKLYISLDEVHRVSRYMPYAILRYAHKYEMTGSGRIFYKAFSMTLSEINSFSCNRDIPILT